MEKSQFLLLILDFLKVAKKCKSALLFVLLFYNKHFMTTLKIENSATVWPWWFMKIKIFLKKVNLSLKQGKENYKELIIRTVRNKLNAISTITICLSNIFQANFLFMVHVPLKLALGRVLSDQKSAPPLSIKTWRS